jgi:hypothetical protein
MLNFLSFLLNVANFCIFFNVNFSICTIAARYGRAVCVLPAGQHRAQSPAHQLHRPDQTAARAVLQRSGSSQVRQGAMESAGTSYMLLLGLEQIALIFLSSLFSPLLSFVLFYFYFFKPRFVVPHK